MCTKVFVDTNCLIQYSTEIFNTYNKIYISGYTIHELDKLKISSDETTKYQARNAGRLLEQHQNKIEYVIDENNFDLPKEFDFNNMDNKIISIYKQLWEKDNSIIGLSNDLLFRQKCKMLGLPCEKFDSGEKNEIYKGYKEIILTEYELATFYECKINKWNLQNNEFIIIMDGNKDVVDKFKWTNKGFIPLSYRQIDNVYTGKIKPRNVQQELAFDLLQNKNITCKVIFGKHGSGKDIIMSSHALNMIQRGIYDKIIFVRNNYGVKNSKDIGYLPGNSDDKLLPFAMPLADHVGGVDGLKMLISQNKIELQHLGFIRGRDIKNSIVYCSEAENMTKEHIQLLISRLAEGSALWLNGDFKQVDDKIFERNSGLKQIINMLSGNELFGCVEFSVTERSKTAQLADLLG
jgi:PhoH-like ATPase